MRKMLTNIRHFDGLAKQVINSNMLICSSLKTPKIVYEKENPPQKYYRCRNLFSADKRGFRLLLCR